MRLVVVDEPSRAWTEPPLLGHFKLSAGSRGRTFVQFTTNRLVAVLEPHIDAIHHEPAFGLQDQSGAGSGDCLVSSLPSYRLCKHLPTTLSDRVHFHPREGNIRTAVWDSAAARKAVEGEDDQMSPGDLAATLREISRVSMDEVDLLIRELKTLRRKLRTEGERIELTLPNTQR
jgi:hypothetical protein